MFETTTKDSLHCPDMSQFVCQSQKNPLFSIFQLTFQVYTFEMPAIKRIFFFEEKKRLSRVNFIFSFRMTTKKWIHFTRQSLLLRLFHLLLCLKI